MTSIRRSSLSIRRFISSFRRPGLSIRRFDASFRRSVFYPSLRYPIVTFVPTKKAIAITS
ncbi:hypothetical protein [Lysinibacillus xylanilyticus]|uniref:hypothetical protein n=1 Tax=Lysinibacillus xylanilyticus TaxID=582475 RepID=UPI003821BF9A